jgi:hypothetical protein
VEPQDLEVKQIISSSHTLLSYSSTPLLSQDASNLRPFQAVGLAFANMICTTLLSKKEERRNVMGIILIVILVILFAGALPTWGHSKSWGPYPSGGIGLVLLILVILILLGRI